MTGRLSRSRCAFSDDNSFSFVKNARAPLIEEIMISLAVSRGEAELRIIDLEEKHIVKLVKYFFISTIFSSRFSYALLKLPGRFKLIMMCWPFSNVPTTHQVILEENKQLW